MNKSLIAALASMVVVNAWAQDQTYDTRSLAMGGAGVASANTRNAAFLNPSMLNTKAEEDAFAWEVPIGSLRVLDEKNLLGDADTLKQSADALTIALQNFQAAQTVYLGNAAALPALQAAAGQAAGAILNFGGALTGVSGKVMSGSAFGGTMLGVPGKTFSFALTADARAELGGRFNYSTADGATLLALGANLGLCAGGVVASCSNAAAAVGANGTVNGMTSTLDLRGVLAKEVGISIATRFGDGIDVGITPKLAKLTTFDVSQQAQQANGVTTNNGANNETTANMFNMDVGVSTQLSGNDKEGLRAGIVVKDMFSRNYKTVLGNDIAIRPRMTAGVGYKTELTTTALDIDLVPNKSLIAGYGADSQFVRIGAEFDAWSWAQFRIGYRHDLKNNYKGLTSAGVGLSIFGLHMDISAAAASKSEAAVSAQLGLHF